MTDNILRQSQLVTTYGPGAMMDLPDCSVLVSGLDEWCIKRRERVEEPRLVAKLRRLLGVPTLQLWTPPRHEENDPDQAPVGARLFPTWFLVNESVTSPGNPQWRRRRLVQWDHLDKMRFHDEDGRRKPVVPVRFVCGCRRGHIADVNWRRFVHPKGQSCGRPLWLEERGPGTDIGQTFAVCSCGEARSLAEASSPKASALGHCAGKRPWIGLHATEECNEFYRLLVRTASNAYFAQTMSVISLPEFDAKLESKVSAHYGLLKAADDFGALESFRKSPELDAAFAGIADDEVMREYRRQQNPETSKKLPVKTAEIQILDKGDRHIGENEVHSRFYAETLTRADWDPGHDPLLAAVDKLVLVHRLREVVALTGFTRLEAMSPDKDGELDLEVIRASLAETITWLPAVENRGEGVFLSLKSGHVNEWLSRPGVEKRGQVIQEGWRMWAAERRCPHDEFPGLPYVMLHSLAHMLMTSIAIDCGYPASSLRERVYAGDAGYGILIYTGSSDAEGTLGGLVETGRHLATHLRRALDDGRLCSNDPVCAEHAPNSPFERRMLHGAACHGCLLVAETSCEQRNDFLDRALVVATVGIQDAAFFDTGSHGL